MLCRTCSNEAVVSSALGKEFFYCRTCKVEVEPAALHDPNEAVSKEALSDAWGTWTLSIPDPRLPITFTSNGILFGGNPDEEEDTDSETGV